MLTSRRTDAPLRVLLRRPLLVGLAALVAVTSISLGLAVLVVTVVGERIDRTDRMLSALQDGHVAMLNQETALRGFLVTREERFLAPYRDGSRELGDLDTVLEELAVGDRELAESITALEEAQFAWIRGWARPVLADQPDIGDAAALADLLTADKALFDEYRAVQAATRTVVEDRRTQVLAFQRAVLLGGALLGLGVAGGVALAVRRANRRLAAALLPPTQQVRETLSGLTAGRLDSRAEEAGPAELRDIAGDVNRLAAALRERVELVAARERELVAARDQAEQAGQAKTAFLATMSHEIRTPLNAVLGLTDLLLTTELDEEQHAHLRTISGSGDALLTLINDILDFSKIEAGELDLDRAPFDLPGLVYDVAALMAPQAAGKGLDLLVDVPADCEPEVLGDGPRLRQVVLNLVGNAVKFTAHGHVLVSVDATRVAGRVRCRIAVGDTGIGIPPDQQQRLFRSFSQGDASTTRCYGGTGLGLAISRRIAEAMGGSISVDSRAGVGSTFTVEVVLEAGAVRGRPEPGLAGLRVLAVDDNPVNLRILEHQLGGQGAEVVAVTGGAEALGVVVGDPVGFAAAVVDLHMPGMDGVELAARLRRLPAAPGLPLVLLSSSAAAAPEHAGLFAARLSKPVRPDRLVHALRSAVHGAPDASAAAGGSPAAERGGGPLRVLVAEDHAVNAELARLYLRTLGHESVHVPDGAAAVEAVRTGAFDVVLMDAQMPVLGGVDATAAIRALPVAQPRILALTASVLTSDRTAFLAAGADAFLTKPVRLAVLAEALADAVSAPVTVPVSGAPGDVPAGTPDGSLDPELVEELRDLGEDAFASLYGRYAENLRTTVSALRAAADGGSWSEDDDASVPRLAHRLKGSSAAMGATRLAGICEGLQVLDAAPPDAELRRALADLEAESARVGSAVDGLLAR